MTAIAGVWHQAGAPGALEACARMLRPLALYGPGDRQALDAGEVALGRALSHDLPEDRFDVQPLVGGGGRYVLAADLRLDNRSELSSSLGLPDAARLADSAILLAAFERWGESVFDHLLGDYAFAVWNRTSRRLLLARDPIGMRPLFFHQGKNFFAFASMVKGLHALPQIPMAPNTQRVFEELALMPQWGTQSFFAGVERVEPGTYLTLDERGLRHQRHWQPRRAPIQLKSAEDYADALRDHLDRAVAARLRGADGTVAAHLSSGLDSSSVTTSAALQFAPGRVVAYTAVPREGFTADWGPRMSVDEGPAAARTAALYPNIEHVRIVTNGRSPLTHLDRNFHLFERPVLNLCNAIWSHAINDAAKARGIRILLTGQLGNMTLSYDGLTLLPTLLAQGRLLEWARYVRALHRSGAQTLRTLAVRSIGPFVPVPVWQWLARFGNNDTRLSSFSALNPRDPRLPALKAVMAERGLDHLLRPNRDGFDVRLWMLRWTDLGSYNKGVLGGWGLDSRDPTADTRLIEFCLNVPEAQWLAGGEPRALLKRVLQDRVPEDVRAHRRHGYQAADWHEGLNAARGDVAGELERLRSTPLAADALDLPRLHALVETWPSRDWDSQRVRVQYRLALLRGLSNGHFLRKASGGNA